MALKDVVTRYDIPRVYMDDLISGMEDDLYTNRYQTFDDLYRYCYRVASVVGLTCVEICGYEDDAAREFAEAWGIFMQLTNILRDVVEDAEENRVYLPLDELKKHGIDPDELTEDLSDDLRWKAFVSDFIGRAESYYFRAQQLLPLLDRSSRYSPAAMMAFYRSVLKKIKKRDGDVFHGAALVDGGAKGEALGILAIKREIKALDEQIEAEQEIVRRLTAEHVEMVAASGRAETALTQVQQERHQQEKVMLGHELQLASLGEEAERLARKLDVIETERRTAGEERDGLEARRTEAQASIERLEADRAGVFNMGGAAVANYATILQADRA